MHTTTRLIVKYSEITEKDILNKTENSQDSTRDDYARAEYSLWYEVLNNSSFFTEENNTEENSYLCDKVFFVCGCGKICLGLDPYEDFSPSVWPRFGDLSCEKFIYSKNLEKFIEILAKAFNEYYDVEIYLKFINFEDLHFSTLLISDNKEEIEKDYAWRIEEKKRRTKEK